MTRLTLLPILLCLPLVSHAQKTSTKEASFVSPAESAPLAPSANSVAPAPAPAATTSNTVPTAARGIVPPKLVHTLSMKDDGNQHVHLEGRQRVVIVYLTVNESGEPTDLHIPEPVDDALDVEVLATVGKFRYQPGTLDGKPTSMPVHMHYVVPVGAIY